MRPTALAVRQGDWKLVWQATLPSKAELFDVAHDPSEQSDVAAQHPDIVARLQQRVEVLAKDAVPPLILVEAMPMLKHQLFGTVALPADVKALQAEP